LNYLNNNEIANNNFKIVEKISNFANIKIGETEFLQNGKTMKLNHLFLKF